MGRFALIFINAEQTYHFQDFHRLFENRPSQELQVLNEILFKPMQQKPMSHKMFVVFQLVLAYSIPRLYSKPVAAIKWILRSLIQTATGRETKTPVH
jgi:hypothetical protein